MQFALTVLVSIVMFVGPQSASAQPAAGRAPAVQSGNAVTVTDAIVAVINEAQVPAMEPGVLTAVNVEDGTQVAKDDVLAQIDDSQAKIAKKKALADMEASKVKAENTVEIRFAQAAYAVSLAELRKAEFAESKVRGAIGDTEIKRLQLTAKKSELQIEQAEVQQSIAEHDVAAKRAEAEGAEDSINRRQIKSPLDGIVVRRNFHLGEWVKPGDAVFHVVGVDRLKVEGYVSSLDYGPEELAGRPVVIEITGARKKKLKFAGKVVYVAPNVEGGNLYQVRAHVENRQDPNTKQWLLRPGVTAEMTISLR